MSFLRVAHRGAPTEAPENTLAAFRAALRHAIDGVELDVRFSRDDRAVVHHDADLVRTAGRNERVADLDIETLRGVDVGSWFGEEFSGERIPELDEALAAIGHDTRAFVEVKDGPLLSTAASLHLKSVLREGADRNSLILVSFHAPVLLAMKEHIPHLRTALLLGQPARDPVGKLVASRSSMLFLHHEGVSEGIVSFCHVAGYPVIAWTVDDPDEMRRVLDCEVAGIVSNRPDLFPEVWDGAAA